jgi:hypothetical protein
MLITITVSVGVKYVNMGANFFLGLAVFSLISVAFGTVLFASGVYTGHLSSADRNGFDNFHRVYAKDPGKRSHNARAQRLLKPSGAAAYSSCSLCELLGAVVAVIVLPATHTRLCRQRLCAHNTLSSCTVTVRMQHLCVL